MLPLVVSPLVCCGCTHTHRAALNTVSGVGPVLAKQLLDEKGIDSVAALAAAVNSGALSVKKDVQVGLKHYKDLMHRIPRTEVRDCEFT